jgi:hypothetical protein
MCPTDGELQTYLDGEMDMSHREALVRHLAVCPRCEGRVTAASQRRADIVSLIGGEAAQLPRESASIALARFHARVAAADRGRAFAAVLEIGYAMCVLAVAALAIAVFTHSRSGAIALAPASHARAGIAPTAAWAAEPAVPVRTVSADPTHTPSPARPQTHRARRTAVSDTFLLLTDDVAPPEMGIVVRVRMPLSALAAAIPAEPRAGAEPQIEADVLVGQDGRARAIRFVNQTLPSGGK